VLKENFKVKCSGTEPVVHVFKNVYVVPTPIGPNAAFSKIEDLFDDAIKATQIDGKTFNPGNAIDKEKEYGKNVFAHKVVTPKAGTIDFTGFRPLLTNITAGQGRCRAPDETLTTVIPASHPSPSLPWGRWAPSRSPVQVQCRAATMANGARGNRIPVCL
jgi:hypothetical protein